MQIIHKKQENLLHISKVAPKKFQRQILTRKTKDNNRIALHDSSSVPLDSFVFFFQLLHIRCRLNLFCIMWKKITNMSIFHLRRIFYINKLHQICRKKEEVCSEDGGETPFFLPSSLVRLVGFSPWDMLFEASILSEGETWGGAYGNPSFLFLIPTSEATPTSFPSHL